MRQRYSIFWIQGFSGSPGISSPLPFSAVALRGIFRKRKDAKLLPPCSISCQETLQTFRTKHLNPPTMKKSAKTLCIPLCALFFQGWGQNLSAQSSIPINPTHFPDSAFRKFVEQYDSDKDGQLSQTECQIKRINCSQRGIYSLEGIQYFTHLEILVCRQNQISQLDLSGCPNLTELKCYNNHLSSLDLSNTTKLETLDCTFNPLTYLDLSHTPDLSSLSCIETRLVSLDLSHTPKLTRMDCFYNWHPLDFGRKKPRRHRPPTRLRPRKSLQFRGCHLGWKPHHFFPTRNHLFLCYRFSKQRFHFQSVTFTLYADPAPSVDNETSDNARQGRVYAKDRTLYTEGIEDMVSVFNPAGGLVYQGSQNRIPVNSPGIYILRHGNQTWKIFVM